MKLLNKDIEVSASVPSVVYYTSCPQCRSMLTSTLPGAIRKRVCPFCEKTFFENRKKVLDKYHTMDYIRQKSRR